MTGIEWTDATWNPATGCSKVSAGCANCYAERVAVRLKGMGQAKYADGFRYTEHPAAVGLPLRWKKPRRIFVNSMSDLFHEDASFPFIARVLEVMLRADHHTYQILTKRPERMDKFMRAYFTPGIVPPPHIWLGTSVENDDALHRIDTLRNVPAAVRFVSFEPLIGPVRRDVDLSGIHWAIIGGESGPGHRPMRQEWVEALVYACRLQNVPIFFKQWGGDRPGGPALVNGSVIREYPEAPA